MCKHTHAHKPRQSIFSNFLSLQNKLQRCSYFLDCNHNHKNTATYSTQNNWITDIKSLLNFLKLICEKLDIDHYTFSNLSSRKTHNLYFEHHVNHFTRSADFCLRNISILCPSLSSAAEANSFFTSRIDCRKTVFFIVHHLKSKIISSTSRTMLTPLLCTRDTSALLLCWRTPVHGTRVHHRTWGVTTCGTPSPNHIRDCTDLFMFKSLLNTYLMELPLMCD